MGKLVIWGCFEGKGRTGTVGGEVLLYCISFFTLE